MTNGIHVTNFSQQKYLHNYVIVTYEVILRHGFCLDYALCKCTMQIRLCNFQQSITTPTGLLLESILNYHSRNKGVTGKTMSLESKQMQHKSCHICYAFIQHTSSQFKNTILGSFLTLATINPLQHQMTKGCSYLNLL